MAHKERSFGIESSIKKSKNKKIKKSKSLLFKMQIEIFLSLSGQWSKFFFYLAELLELKILKKRF